MKTSKPTRLSEKLNAELDTIRQDYAASMASQLVSAQDWITGRMDKKPDMTLNDLVSELAEHHGIAIHRVLVWRFLRSLGFTYKNLWPAPSARGLDFVAEIGKLSVLAVRSRRGQWESRGLVSLTDGSQLFVF